MKLDDTTLVAYVDGELDAEATRQVETLLAEDPKARETVRRLHETTGMIRAAFAETLHQPVPLRTVDALTRAASAAQGPGNGRGVMFHRIPYRMPLAAALAALIIGFGGGYFGADWRLQRASAELEAARNELRANAQATLERSLESEKSGTTVTWQSPDGALRVDATPVSTYRDANGGFCREFVEKRGFRGTLEIWNGLSCRTEDGHWKTRFLIKDLRESL